MNDPIHDLEHALAQAARRRLNPPSAPLRRHVSRRTALAALGALVIAGSATAATIHFTGTPSKPLAGPIGPGERGHAYALSLIPDWRAGAAGWCTLLRLTTGAGLTSAGAGCGPAPAAGSGLIAGGMTYGQHGRGLEYAVTSADTRAVRFGNVTVATSADASLPSGWRYAIHIADTPSTTSSGGPPATPRFAPPVLLDAQGRTIPFQAPGARNGRAARSRPVTQANPARRCAIGTAPGYIAGYARVAVGAPKLASHVQGRPFFSCAYTVFHRGDIRGGLTAAILLDAQFPDRAAPDLPHAPGISARRLGRAWLVVYGRSAPDRARLLERLRPRL